MPTDGKPPIPEIIIVVGGGDAPGSLLTSMTPGGPERQGHGATVIAADSGLDVAQGMGLPVDHLVGDLDSVSAPARRSAEVQGVRVHAHERDKDATDLELALDLALELLAWNALAAAGSPSASPLPAARLTVVGPGAGRLDHLLADVSLLAAPRLAALEVRARFGIAHLTVVPPGVRRAVGGEPGEQISLLPVHGSARGVTTTGLRWALRDADLAAGTSRGLSNEVVHPEASVAVGEGILVVVRPGTCAPDVARRTTAYDPSPRTLDPPEELS